MQRPLGPGGGEGLPLGTFFHSPSRSIALSQTIAGHRTESYEGGGGEIYCEASSQKSAEDAVTVCEPVVLGSQEGWLQATSDKPEALQRFKGLRTCQC